MGSLVRVIIYILIINMIISRFKKVKGSGGEKRTTIRRRRPLEERKEGMGAFSSVSENESKDISFTANNKRGIGNCKRRGSNLESPLKGTFKRKRDENWNLSPMEKMAMREKELESRNKK